MAPYEVRFLNHADAVFGTETFRAKDDAHAIERARTVYRSPVGKGHEIWQGERLVHMEAY